MTVAINTSRVKVVGGAALKEHVEQLKVRSSVRVAVKFVNNVTLIGTLQVKVDNVKSTVTSVNFKWAFFEGEAETNTLNLYRVGDVNSEFKSLTYL